MNHADNDCLVIVVLSHGDMEFLYAADQRYNPENLWAPFSSDSCQTLAGKPKLFFIQACQVRICVFFLTFIFGVHRKNYLSRLNLRY